MSEFYKPLKGPVPRIHVLKYNQPHCRIERASRLYSTQFAQAWSLQIRAPLGIGTYGYEDGKTDVIANASLYREDMIALRDALNEALAVK